MKKMKKQRADALAAIKRAAPGSSASSSNVPAKLLCTLGGHVVRDPVRTSPGGPVYERASLHRWIDRMGHVDPESGAAFEAAEVVAATDVLESVRRWRVGQRVEEGQAVGRGTGAGAGAGTEAGAGAATTDDTEDADEDRDGDGDGAAVALDGGVAPAVGGGGFSDGNSLLGVFDEDGDGDGDGDGMGGMGRGDFLGDDLYSF